MSSNICLSAINRHRLMTEGLISIPFLAIEFIMNNDSFSNTFKCLLHPIILNILSHLILEHQGIWKMVMYQLLFFVANRKLYWEIGSSQKKFAIDERRNVFIEQNSSIILMNIKFKGIYTDHVLHSAFMFKSIRLYLFEFNDGDFYFFSLA